MTPLDSRLYSVLPVSTCMSNCSTVRLSCLPAGFIHVKQTDVYTDKITNNYPTNRLSRPFAPTAYFTLTFAANVEMYYGTHTPVFAPAVPFSVNLVRHVMWTVLVELKHKVNSSCTVILYCK